MITRPYINCIQPTAIFIKARVANREQKCLVDTGATVSLASRHLINGPLKLCTLKARGIGGEELQVLGMVNVPVNVSSLTCPFVVVGTCNICILGVDFLKSGQMVVDMANARLSWPTGGVPLIVEITTPNVSIFLLIVQMIPLVELPRQSIVLAQEIIDLVNNDHIGSPFTFIQLLMSK